MYGALDPKTLLRKPVWEDPLVELVLVSDVTDLRKNKRRDD